MLSSFFFFLPSTSPSPSLRWIVSKTAYLKEARSKCGMEKTFGSKGLDGRATHEEYLNVCKVSANVFTGDGDAPNMAFDELDLA